MPYQIGRFTIVGEHEPEQGDYCIRLLPQEHHAAYPWWSASTRAVLEALTPEDVAGKAVLDFGCGASAILGLAAARCGATVMFVESHPDLAAIATRQIEANGFEPRVLPEPTGRFDIALANVGDAHLVGQVAQRATHGIGTDSENNVIRW